MIKLEITGRYYNVTFIYLKPPKLRTRAQKYCSWFGFDYAYFDCDVQWNSMALQVNKLSMKEIFYVT